jgi:D-methionine transport system substrate-binding protein
MKFKKTIIASVAALALTGFITGCGDEKKAAAPAPKDSKAVTLKVGVSPVPHAEILGAVKDKLAKEGINVEIIEFTDYVQPNLALNDKNLDANYFQHKPYLDEFARSRNLKLVSAGAIHLEPMSVFSKKIKDLKDLPDGARVAIPNDPTNGGRALKVLEAAGLIELDPNAAFNPTVDDITSYKVNITIEELKANTIPSVLPDVAAAVVNGNYALDFGLKTDEAIYKDSVLDVEEYWNLIAARTADVEDPDTAAIYEKVVEAFQSSATEDVFNNTFGGYFIAVGWDQDLINQ